MTQPKYKVTYISNSCGNTDELSNQPHESVAQSLYNLLINHKEVTHPVIGIEGSWGSGKSQVINILQRIIKDENKTAIMVTHDIAEAISMADKVVVLSKRPAIIKNTYEIKMDDKTIPSENRKNKDFYNYYNAIWKDLDYYER